MQGPQDNFTRPYPGQHFETLQPERGLEHTMGAPPIGVPPPTSLGELLKVLLDMRNMIAVQNKAWQDHWAAEEKRRHAWMHTFPFRMARNTQLSFPQISGIDARWIVVNAWATSAEEGLVYGKLADHFNIDLADQLPYSGDWDYVTKTDSKSPVLPCRDAQAFCLYTTAAVEGTISLAGDKEVLPG